MGVRPFSVRELDLETGWANSNPLLFRTIAITERVLAAVLLLLSIPALLLIAFLISVLSRRSPFIAHRRVGQGGREIWIFKFRTMWTKSRVNCNLWPPVERVPADYVNGVKPRLDSRVNSRFASFCRKYSIDEWPQLWHVIRGEMSLVGPRPLTNFELATYYGPDRVYLLSVKPGLTGLWQTKGRSRLSYSQRKRLDLFLIQHWSPGLYLAILKATIPCVLAGKNAW